MKRNIYIGLGFCLVIVGMTSLFLGLSGVIMTIMKPVDNLSPEYAFGVKIIIIIFGFVLAYLGYLEGENVNEDEI